MLKGFKDFLMRGNVVDLAVAVIIGTAFTAIVTAIATNLINPLIAAIGGANVNGLAWTLVDGNPESTINFAAIITAAINFVIIAAIVYFLIVVPMKHIQERRKRGEEAGPAEPTDVELLTEIRDLLVAQQSSTQHTPIGTQQGSFGTQPPAAPQQQAPPPQQQPSYPPAPPTNPQPVQPQQPGWPQQGGYPDQGNRPQAGPQYGGPQQGYPAQQGYPEQGGGAPQPHPDQGGRYPDQGRQGYQQQGYPDQGNPPQDYPHQGGYPDQGGPSQPPR